MRPFGGLGGEPCGGNWAAGQAIMFMRSAGLTLCRCVYRKSEHSLGHTTAQELCRWCEACWAYTQAYPRAVIMSDWLDIPHFWNGLLAVSSPKDFCILFALELGFCLVSFMLDFLIANALTIRASILHDFLYSSFYRAIFLHFWQHIQLGQSPLSESFFFPNSGETVATPQILTLWPDART